MARFRYGLQAALTTHADRESKAAGAFAVARNALDAELGALALLEDAKAATGRELAARGCASALDFQTFDLRLSALDAARMKASERIALARRRVAETRAALEAARRQKTALERHRERKRTEFEAEQELRECAEFDEGNALRAALRR